MRLCGEKISGYYPLKAVEAFPAGIGLTSTVDEVGGIALVSASKTGKTPLNSCLADKKLLLTQGPSSSIQYCLQNRRLAGELGDNLADIIAAAGRLKISLRRGWIGQSSHESSRRSLNWILTGSASSEGAKCSQRSRILGGSVRMR